MASMKAKKELIMKRNESMREHRSLNPFKHIRFGFAPIEAEDEFANCLNEESSVRPDYFRWFCGMHDLEETYVCQVL